MFCKENYNVFPTWFSFACNCNWKNKIKKDNFKKNHNKKTHVDKHYSNPHSMVFYEKSYSVFPNKIDKDNLKKKHKKKTYGETL
jgi:competence transcription factor ComK